MPDALDALRRLGIGFSSDQSFLFRGIRFIGDGGTVAADFRREPGVAIRRVRLHQMLMDRAEDLGVKLFWRTHVNSLCGIRARWIIGADGQNSRVRKWSGLDAIASQSCRYGFRRHYSIAPWTDFMEIYWGAGCQMYVTGISSNTVAVALIVRDSHMRIDQAMPLFPELERRLQGARPITEERGAITFTRRLKRVYRGNTVLIGDASGSVDAITGAGISLAFRQAVALADALVTGDLERYQTAHRRMRRRPAFMAQAMLLLDRFPIARPYVLRSFGARPAIFETLLAVHAGA